MARTLLDKTLSPCGALPDMKTVDSDDHGLV